MGSSPGKYKENSSDHSQGVFVDLLFPMLFALGRRDIFKSAGTADDKTDKIIDKYPVAEIK